MLIMSAEIIMRLMRGDAAFMVDHGAVRRYDRVRREFLGSREPFHLSSRRDDSYQ